jgi:hypothetical protein
MQILLAIMLLWIALQMIISATMLHHHDWQLVPQLSVPLSVFDYLGGTVSSSSSSSSSSSTLARSKNDFSSLAASPSTNSRSNRPNEPENHPQHENEGAKQEQRERQQAEYCLQNRGTQGHWVLDWDYAAAHQYPTFGTFPRSMIANQRFQSKNNENEYPYLPATAYRWQEDTYTPDTDTSASDDQSPRPTCSTPLLTADGFCRVAAALNVTRVYTAGDSLQEAFASSFRALLGFPKWASIQFIKKPLFLHCNITANTNWTVIHIYRRVQTANTDFEAFFRDATLRETRRDFLVDREGGGRTLIVVNVGAHVHSVANFTTSFKNLLSTVDSGDLLSAEDLVFFRNSVPGHANCWPRGIRRDTYWRDSVKDVLRDAPYHNYSEYQLSLSSPYKSNSPENDDPYDWNLLEEYNAYAARRLQERRQAQQQEATTVVRTPVVRLLNIWNATILRKDGHVGFDDCLHYNLPGPTDWWVHLWYAALQDLAVLEQ